MSNLKTLKDIAINPYDVQIRIDMRKEAIKWVKQIRSIGIDRKYTMENDFMNFFNITSEDLKGSDKKDVVSEIEKIRCNALCKFHCPFDKWLDKWESTHKKDYQNSKVKR